MIAAGKSLGRGAAHHRLHYGAGASLPAGVSVLTTRFNVGIKEVSDRIWLVSFMDYDLGFFDHESGRLGSAENPFAAKALPM